MAVEKLFVGACRIFIHVCTHDTMLTQTTLKEWLHYEPNTGVFTWLKQPTASVPVGSIAGWQHHDYCKICLLSTHYPAHRLAWLYVYGVLPDKSLDHINGDKSDNRISNLRMATCSENGINRTAPANNSSGYKGVSWQTKVQAWVAAITKDGKHVYAGQANSPEEAHILYCKKGLELFGEYFNPGYTEEPLAISNKRIEIEGKLATRRDNVSGYPGVGWHSQRNMWRARYRGKHVGFYNDPLEAYNNILAISN